jgi:hypothetical protein
MCSFSNSKPQNPNAKENPISKNQNPKARVPCCPVGADRSTRRHVTPAFQPAGSDTFQCRSFPIGAAARLECLPKVIFEMVGDDLPVVVAKRQLCPTISEITFGNRSRGWKASLPPDRNVGDMALASLRIPRPV